MAITFPRAIPDQLLVTGLSFYPDPMIEVTPLRSGKKISSDIGPTLWRGKWQSPLLTEDQYSEVSAWYTTLLSAEAFYGWDKLREYPRAYRDGWGSLTVGGNPFDGTGKLQSVAAGLVEVTINTLPASFVFSAGDYMAWDYGTDARALHKVVASATANGSGVVTVEVRPAVRVGWAVNAVVSLYRPAAKMIIVPKSWSEQEEPPFFGRVSFEAEQTL